MKKLSIADLNQLYTDGESVDNEIWAEQRSNILLVSGEHYNRRSGKFLDRIRENKDLSPEQKIRLTKNHIQKIMKLYVNNILSYAPGVQITPTNEKEQQDIKAAELHSAVWKCAKDKYDLQSKRRQWCEDFFNIGEVVVKLFWDPSKGKLLGYEPSMGEDGEPVVNEMGEQEDDKARPIFSGDFVFERVFAMNLFRPKTAKDMQDATWLGIRKMVPTKDLEYLVKGDEEKLKFIHESSDRTFTVFDGAQGMYRDSKGEVMVREIYFKPCIDYPTGYFFIFTEEGVLFEGEIPYGVYPLIYEGCEEFQTTPRARSPIKHGRPFQAEINRAASKIAEHQTSLGDDKLVFTNGSQVTQGAQLTGIRTVYTTGPAPTVIQGRVGEQYVGYLEYQISELYSVMMVQEDTEEGGNQQVDPHSLLYKSLRQRKRFSTYAEKFERFQRNVCKTYLDLARYYLPEDEIIYKVGRSEQINISEFKNATPLGYQIVVESMSEDVDSMMGKQLVYNHILQYVGPQLQRDDIGKLIQSMPFANAKDAFSDFTIDAENATNDILMLDRGQPPTLLPGQNIAYTLKKLTSRTKQADFQFLDPQISQMYADYIVQMEQALAVEQQNQAALNADMIPAQGFLTPCDFYVPDPANPEKTRRARLPIDSLSWLVQRLEQQGMTLERLEGLQTSAQAGVGRQVMLATNAGAEAQGQAGQPQNTGQPYPQGAMNGDSSGQPRI
jgi:hypothetical protein